MAPKTDFSKLCDSMLAVKNVKSTVLQTLGVAIYRLISMLISLDTSLVIKKIELRIFQTNSPL